MLYPHQAEISNFCYSYSFFLNVNVKQPGNCSQQSNRECYRAIKVHSLIPIVQHTTLPYHTIFSITILFDIIQFELSAFISWSTTNRMYITEHTLMVNASSELLNVLFTFERLWRWKWADCVVCDLWKTHRICASSTHSVCTI